MTTSTDSPSSGSGESPSAVRVDARGLRCPLPLLRAKQALRDLPAGAQVEVLATDAGSVRDFHAFVDIAGHRMLSFSDADGVYTYVLTKGSAGAQQC